MYEWQNEIAYRAAPRWAWAIIDDILGCMADPDLTMVVEQDDKAMAREAFSAMLTACSNAE